MIKQIWHRVTGVFLSADSSFVFDICTLMHQKIALSQLQWRLFEHRSSQLKCWLAVSLMFSRTVTSIAYACVLGKTFLEENEASRRDKIYCSGQRCGRTVAPFFVRSGWIDITVLMNGGDEGLYWSSSTHPSDTGFAYRLNLHVSGVYPSSLLDRFRALPLRCLAS